jgi:hypothetical protein
VGLRILGKTRALFSADIQQRREADLTGWKLTEFSPRYFLR